MVQHMRDEGAMEHDAVVWDAAPLMQPPGIIPPTDLGGPTDQNDDSQADNTEVYKCAIILVNVVHVSAANKTAPIFRQHSRHRCIMSTSRF